MQIIEINKIKQLIMSRLYSFLIFFLSLQNTFAQSKELFLEDYYFIKNINSEKATEYNDIVGNPYLNREFTEGIFYFMDSTAFKLPVRYNIYADEIEYQLEGKNYAVNDPKSLSRILLGESIFIFINSNKERGYFELLEQGKYTLLQKREVKFRPEEGPKPIEGTIKPASFVKYPDTFYIMTQDSEIKKIINLKSLIMYLEDHKVKIKNFIKKEKIKKAKKENLIKIIKYCNML
jgi:hypothetical protein